MCFPPLETHETTARSQLNLPKYVFKELCGVLCNVQSVETDRNTIEKLCVAWRRQYTHFTTGQLLRDDIMQYFPGLYSLIQTRRA